MSKAHMDSKQSEMHDTLFELLLPFSVLLLFLFLLLFTTFSNTGVHCTCVQCTVGHLGRFFLFLLFGTLCFNIVNLDSFHVWFLFFIFICLPLQCDVGSRLVLEHLALGLVLVELGALLGGGGDLGLLSQGVHPASQGSLRGEHSRHFALELRAGLSNK